MTKLLWDQVGSKYFESGIDHGVLYLSDGSGVPWNGITSVEEDFSGYESTPYYADGVKYMDSQSSDDYAATLKAFTYPDEFLNYEGVAKIINGFLVDDQSAQPFNLSYRTNIGNDLNGVSLGYKLHILYNLMAVEDTPTYSTLGSANSALEFSWKLTSIPSMLNGYRPTSHIILDSRYVEPHLLQNLSDLLYGNTAGPAALPDLDDLVPFLIAWHLITVVDNGDGTATISGPDDLIVFLNSTTFTVNSSNITIIDANTYTIGSSDI